MFHGPFFSRVSLRERFWSCSQCPSAALPQVARNFQSQQCDEKALCTPCNIWVARQHLQSGSEKMEIWFLRMSAVSSLFISLLSFFGPAGWLVVEIKTENGLLVIKLVRLQDLPCSFSRLSHQAVRLLGSRPQGWWNRYKINIELIENVMQQPGHRVCPLGRNKARRRTWAMEGRWKRKLLGSNPGHQADWGRPVERAESWQKLKLSILYIQWWSVHFSRHDSFRIYVAFRGALQSRRWVYWVISIHFKECRRDEIGRKMTTVERVWKSDVGHGVGQSQMEVVSCRPASWSQRVLWVWRGHGHHWRNRSSTEPARESLMDRRSTHSAPYRGRHWATSRFCKTNVEDRWRALASDIVGLESESPVCPIASCSRHLSSVCFFVSLCLCLASRGVAKTWDLQLQATPETYLCESRHAQSKHPHPSA